tara:strand:+ start:5325 stop:6455 length:1131 start_codon:yes stop_codon:yes gene_type:complete
MQNRVYKYFYQEFFRYFLVTLFAVVAVIWTIQAVNFLDLVTDDGHAFRIYLLYSFLTLPKVITKLIPSAFLVASILAIHKMEKDNELIILWTSGLNKIHIVNLIFRISLLVTILQFIMACLVTPETLNTSRSLLKNSQLQFVPSLLKEKKFNDTVEGLTIFVNKKNIDGTYNNIFIRDDGATLTNISSGSGSSTIFAKSGFVSKDEKILILLNGNIQQQNKDNEINIVRFKRTEINLSGLNTKTISEPKIQETSTIDLANCLFTNQSYIQNCNNNIDFKKDVIIEFNKRFGMPIYIPLISLIICFLLTSRKEKKFSGFDKWIYGIIGFTILVCSEITVRYSGISLKHSSIYYLLPVGLLPLLYINLIRVFKYENLN